MTLVRFTSEDSKERNCICYQLDKDIYFTVVEEIGAGNPLVVSYAPGYRVLIDGAQDSQVTIPKVSEPVPPNPKASVRQYSEPLQDNKHANHEHDYSSTTLTKVQPRRSERKRKLKSTADDDFVFDPLTSTPAKRNKTVETSSSHLKTENSIALKKDAGSNMYVVLKQEDKGIENDSEEEVHRLSVTILTSQENKRKEKLKRLGAVLAQEEWECKFCNAVVRQNI